MFKSLKKKKVSIEILNKDDELIVPSYNDNYNCDEPTERFSKSKKFRDIIPENNPNRSTHSSTPFLTAFNSNCSFKEKNPLYFYNNKERDTVTFNT